MPANSELQNNFCEICGEHAKCIYATANDTSNQPKWTRRGKRKRERKPGIWLCPSCVCDDAEITDTARNARKK